MRDVNDSTKIVYVRLIAPHSSKPKRVYEQIYVGNEFCVRLMPSEEQMDRIFDTYTQSKVTLVTSFMPNQYFEQLHRILHAIVTRNKECEIVVNDFGVMHYVAREFKQFHLICGRLLFTQLLNPDSYQKVQMASLGSGFIPSSYVKEPHLFNPAFFRLLKQYGVNRIELNDIDDVLRYGDDLVASSFRLSLYFPYSYLSVTRYCYFAHKAANVSGHRIVACKKECLNKQAEIKKMFLPNGLSFLGNALFVKDKRNYDRARKYIDRVIDNTAGC